MNTHFKLGVYDLYSSGAIHAVIELLSAHSDILLKDGNIENLKSIKIKAFQKAFDNIGGVTKSNPTCRQTADHSMVYIIATLLRKAF